MTGLKGRVVSGLRWQAAAKLGSQLISWGATLVVMRLLAPADYGLMAMTMILVGLTSLVAEMGLGAALVRSPEVTVAQQRAVFGLALLVNTGLYLALLALAPLSVALFSEPKLWALTAAMGLQLPLAALCVVPESMARRELRFKQLSVVEIVQQVGAAATTLACAWAGLGVWALVAGHLAATLIKTLLLLRFGTVMPRFALRGQRELATFGGALTANRLVWFAYTQADVFIAGKLLGPQLTGAYAAAVNLANMPMQKLMGISNQVAYSAFSRLQGDPKALAQGVLGSLRITATIGIGLLWGVGATAPDLIPLLLGPQWQLAVVPLQLVAAVVPLRLVQTTLSTATIAAGHVGTDLRNNLVGLAVLAPAFATGATWGGVNGLALAWLLGFPLVFAMAVKRITGKLGLGLRQVLRQLLEPVAAGAAMWGSIEFVSRMLTGLVPGPLSLAVQVAVGGLVYVAVVALIDRPTLRELRSFVQRSPA